MVVWKFKSCPRCGGDMFVDRDHYSWYEQCLQCGYLHDMPSIVEVHQDGEERRGRKGRRSGGVSRASAEMDAVL